MTLKFSTNIIGEGFVAFEDRELFTAEKLEPEGDSNVWHDASHVRMAD